MEERSSWITTVQSFSKVKKGAKMKLLKIFVVALIVTLVSCKKEHKGPVSNETEDKAAESNETESGEAKLENSNVKKETTRNSGQDPILETKEKSTNPPIGFGKDIDDLLKKYCDPRSKMNNVKHTTYDKRKAQLKGYPEGKFVSITSKMKKHGGVIKRDIFMGKGEGSGGIYSMSIFGEAVKPGNKWSKYHFAKIGSEFVERFLNERDKIELRKKVIEYIKKKPSMETWKFSNLTVINSEVFAGEHAGKFVMMVMKPE